MSPESDKEDKRSSAVFLIVCSTSRIKYIYLCRGIWIKVRGIRGCSSTHYTNNKLLRHRRCLFCPLLSAPVSVSGIMTFNNSPGGGDWPAGSLVVVAAYQDRTEICPRKCAFIIMSQNNNTVDFRYRSNGISFHVQKRQPGRDRDGKLNSI